MVELRWVLGHSSWVRDSPVEATSIKAVQPDANQSQMWLGNKDRSLPSVLHSYEIWVMLPEKILQNLTPERIGVSQIW